MLFSHGGELGRLLYTVESRDQSVPRERIVSSPDPVISAALDVLHHQHVYAEMAGRKVRVL